MKLISWNVNGLRACIQKGFLEQFDQFDADFFCLQETKLSEGQIQLELPGYEQYWCYAENKGYSGTAIFAKHTPQSVHYGLDVPELDNEGRLITLEYPEFYLVTCYTPNAQRELARIDHRMKWDDAFRAYLAKLDAVKPVILCGDLNVAHQEIDLKNPKSNRGSAGFSDQERESFGETLDQGFTDTFRHLHPDARDKYSWWSYMFKARENNAGWRIDYFLVSDRIRDTVYRAEIHDQILGSDHCPVSIETDLPCNGGIFSHSAPGKARDLTAPDDPPDTPRASAVKAKALAPFVAIFAVILLAALLWNPLSALLPQAEPSEPTEPDDQDDSLFTVHVYENPPWTYAKLPEYTTYNFVTDADLYADVFADGDDSYYIPHALWSNYTDSNIAIRIELTERALEMDLDILNTNVEFWPVTDMLDSTIPVADYYASEYYLEPDRTQLGGWFILANIPDTRNYTVSLTWPDQELTETQTLKLSPTGADIPTDIENPMNITDLSGLAMNIYDKPSENGSTVILGLETYYSDAPVSGDQLQNGVWWLLVEPNPQLTTALSEDLLFFSAHCTSSGNDTEEDWPIYGTLYYEPEVRTIYYDPEHTQFLGWIVYSRADIGGNANLSLSWQSVGQYVTEAATHEVIPFAPDPDVYPTDQLLAMIINDTYLHDQYAAGAYKNLFDITWLNWLSQREDGIATLMNYVPNNLDQFPFLHVGLLSQPEFQQLMTPREEALYLVGDYPAAAAEPWIVTLGADAEAASYTTEELALYLLKSTSVHNWLLGECSDQETMLAMLEYMRAQSATLDEFLSREDCWEMTKACSVYGNYEQSILYYIGMLLVLENPQDMTTEQLVAAILQNTALCDSIQDSGPDFENNALLKELATRENAVEYLMNAPEREDYSYLDIPYLLMSHPDIRYNMNPSQEADYLLGTYPSCPYESIYDDQHGYEVLDMTTKDLVYDTLTYGYLSSMSSCTSAESAFTVFEYLHHRYISCAELIWREDTQEILTDFLSSDSLAEHDRTIIAWLVEIWPRIESELCVPDMPYWE